MSDLARLSEWIDDYNRGKDPRLQLWERVGKVMEELGEAIGALIGYLGQNPRKGITHNRSDIEKELLDIAVTALAAHEHMTGNLGLTEEAFFDHLAAVIERAGLNE